MRFFWNAEISWKGVLTHYLIWTSPQSCPDISLNPEVYHNQTKQTDFTNLIIRAKRSVSLFPYHLHGSITVETAFALPVFLVFCIQIMSLISLIQLHSALEASLHQEAAKASLQAYAYDRAGVDIGSGAGGIVNETLLKGRVMNRTGREYLDHSMVKGGSKGIHILFTGEDDRQDVIDVILFYQVRPMVDILGFCEFTMANRCRMKAWTGYQPDTGSEEGADTEELVYITETGTVYHKSKNCSHLSLSIRSVETDSLYVLRNEDGGKYYACERCGRGTGAIVFLTDQGNRYHTSLYCSGLKRTVYTVTVSQAGGRGPCRRCSATG